MTFPAERFAEVGAKPREVDELQDFYGAETTRFDSWPLTRIEDELHAFRSRKRGDAAAEREAEAEAPKSEAPKTADKTKG